MKRLLSLLLCVALLCSMTAVSAYASEEPAVSVSPASEVLEETAEAETQEAVLSDEITADLPGEAEMAEDGGDTPPTDPSVTSGTLGTLSWAVSDGVLSVTGTGEIPDFTADIPWFDCRGIVTKIVIGDGVTRVGNNAFNAFAAATAIELPEGLKTIGTNAFSFCQSVTAVVIPSTVTAIEENAFNGCALLASLSLPAGLKTIGKGAFGWNALTALTLPDGLTTIGRSAFEHSAELTALTLPGSLTSIGEYAFYDSEKLKTVTVGEGVISIPTGCFADCAVLETIALPSTIETLSAGFVNGNNSLTTVTVSANTAEGYEFCAWLDAGAHLYSNDELAANPVEVALTATWQYIWTDGFTDVSESDWYYNYVKYCYQQGLMEGTTGTAFAPLEYATRAQVVMVLYRLAGMPVVTESSEYSDVTASRWYHDAVVWATEVGIAKGYPGGTFLPNNWVTRQEFLTFLYRFSDWKGIVLNEWDDSHTETFEDAADISDWALTAENWSVAVGLQTGYATDNGGYELLPKNYIARSELATFLARYSDGMTDMVYLELTRYFFQQPVSAIVAAYGEPNYTTYDESCLVIGAEDGVWYYDNLTVVTLRYDDGTELVISLF